MKSTPRIKRKVTTRESEDFSFASSGLQYAAKDEYVTNETLFTITALEFQTGRGYNGADRWAATVSRNEGPNEIITLSSNEKRDAQLKAAQSHVTAKGPITNVHLVKHGNTFYFQTMEPRGS